MRYNFFAELKNKTIEWLGSLIKALNLRFPDKSAPVTFLVFPLAVQMNFHSQHPREIRRNPPGRWQFDVRHGSTPTSSDQTGRKRKKFATWGFFDKKRAHFRQATY